MKKTQKSAQKTTGPGLVLPAVVMGRPTLGEIPRVQKGPETKVKEK